MSHAMPGTAAPHRPRVMGPRELIDACCWVWDTHDAARLSLDAHIESCLAQRGGGGGEDTDDATFIAQVVYGLHRYRRLLSGFLDGFFHAKSGKALRTDATRYRVFVYLAAFRAEELGAKNFRRLVESQDAQKMAVLLPYLFDGASLRGHAREDWLKAYDKQFVDDLIERLLAWGAQCVTLLASLNDRVYSTSGSGGGGTRQDDVSSGGGSKPRRAATAAVPFSLSAPRPKPPPQAEPAPPPPRARPPPPPREGPTREELALEAARAANREAAARKHAEARPFRLRVLERPSNTGRLREEAERALAEELAVRPRARPAPGAAAGAEVRLNAAAVLREDALYRKKQAAEALELQRYESELRDCRDFDAWRQAMLDADAASERARVEALRSEMSVAAGNAAEAREGLARARLRAGAADKAARAERARAAAARERRELDEKARLVEGVQAGRGRAAEVAAAAAEARRRAAEGVRQRAEADAQAKAEAEAREMAEKRDIIMRLRALMERGPGSGGGGGGGAGGRKVVDETAAAERGMNEQMSLLELRERLAVAQRRQREEEEERRARILAAKQQREAALLGKVAQLQAIRRLASAQAHARKAAAAASEAATADTARRRADDLTVELAARLEQRRAATAAERARLAADGKRAQHERMQSAAGSAAAEAARFREMREGAHRCAAQRHLEQRRDAVAADATKERAQALRQKAKRQDCAARAGFLAEYDATVAALTAATGAAAAREQRRSAAAAARAREEALWDARGRDAYVPFSGGPTTISERLLAVGRGEGPLE